jgi:hypothetical protein
MSTNQSWISRNALFGMNLTFRTHQAPILIAETNQATHDDKRLSGSLVLTGVSATDDGVVDPLELLDPLLSEGEKRQLDRRRRVDTGIVKLLRGQ